MSAAQPPHWKPWTFDDVVDVNYPAFALRTYLEQADVRAYLRRISAGRRIESACEIGCGYGRITVALGEFASRVVGFERQPEFVEEARRLHPNIEVRQVNSLGELPETDHAFDVVLTFTVLQHLTDAAAVRAIAEIKRLVRPSGFVLLCEETDTSHVSGDLTDEGGRCTIGRSISTYAELLAPCRLIATSRRRIEPNYPRPDVGTYMLFQSLPVDPSANKLAENLRRFLRLFTGARLRSGIKNFAGF
jgi:SAM-dependent methyltransferase